uniref:Lectin-like n=1 Tax=Geotrypetes seraphini TaxID=260995 RepID=A0A6P8PYA8_GEOSA|nr:lectin-like [Geotrypetes seraphini]
MMRNLKELVLILAVVFTAGQAADKNSSCTNGWSCFFSAYYKFVSTPLSWVEAELYCQKLIPGGHLASLHSLEEQQFLMSLSQKSPIWIGSSDSYKDRTFFWTDGSFLDYHNWRSGEPNNYKGIREPCVTLNQYVPGSWNDYICSEMFPFVCKVSGPACLTNEILG